MPDIKRILHPTDFSKCSAAAARYAVRFARFYGAELHLLYVIEDAMGKIPEPHVGFPGPGDVVEVACPN